MKSSENSTASTQNSSIKIQQDSDSLIGEVKKEIIVILDRIKELLKDNQGFLVILISKCLNTFTVFSKNLIIININIHY